MPACGTRPLPVLLSKGGLRGQRAVTPDVLKTLAWTLQLSNIRDLHHGLYSMHTTYTLLSASSMIYAHVPVLKCMRP
jgi:hypothetical protein